MRQPLDPDSASVLVALRLPANLLDLVDAEARRLGVTRSEAIRAILAKALRRAPRSKR